jgi:Rrf2 family transcriptional regulator, iron-sulfur cluster assembly transcription factor
MISKRCTYSLQSLVYLTRERSDRYVPMRQISESLSIPASYLAKILSELANRDFVNTRKGPQGGARLQADPASLSVRDVVVAIDGPGLFESCILGLPECGRQTPCPMHGPWSGTRSALESGFAALTIQELAALMVRESVAVAFLTSF